MLHLHYMYLYVINVSISLSIKLHASTLFPSEIFANKPRMFQDFFDALARVKQIHSDCKVLLRTNQQTAGYVSLLRRVSERMRM